MQLTPNLAKLINGNKNAKIVFSNTFFQLLAKVVSMSITMLTTVLITRNYGVEGYGYFNLMQSIPALFFIIVDFGFNAASMKDLEQNWDNAKKYFFNILWMRLILGVILAFLTAIIIHSFFPYPSDLKFGIYLSLVLILTHALYATGNLIFQFRLRYDYSAIGYILGSVVIFVLSIVLIWNRADIIWVNFTYVIGGLVTFFISLYYLGKLDISYSNSIRVDFTLWKKLFFAAWPLGLTFIFTQVNFRADTVLLSKMSLPRELGFNNVETVAIYGIAYKIFEVCLVVPTFFMNAVYPIYVKKLLAGINVFKAFFIKTTGALLIGGLVITVLGYVLAPFMINILGGEQFVDSVKSLRILFAGISVFFLTAPLSYFILTLGKQKYLPVAYLFAGVFNVTLNLYLIPRYSYLASSYLTWLSELTILLILVFFAIRSWRLYNHVYAPPK